MHGYFHAWIQSASTGNGTDAIEFEETTFAQKVNEKRSLSARYFRAKGSTCKPTWHATITDEEKAMVMQAVLKAEGFSACVTSTVKTFNSPWIGAWLTVPCRMPQWPSIHHCQSRTTGSDSDDADEHTLAFHRGNSDRLWKKLDARSVKRLSGELTIPSLAGMNATTRWKLSLDSCTGFKLPLCGMSSSAIQAHKM